MMKLLPISKFRNLSSFAWLKGSCDCRAEAVVAPKGKTASKKAVAVDLGDVPDWKDGAP